MIMIYDNSQEILKYREWKPFPIANTYQLKYYQFSIILVWNFLDIAIFEV